MDQHKQELLRLISTRTIHVGIIGLGYVGLPLALTFVERASIKLTGFDVDKRKIDALHHGKPYIMHLGAERILAANQTGLFDVTCDFTRLREPDALIIAVPTPLTRQREPDMQFVLETARTIRDNLRPGQLVVLESTTYPGTTDELLVNVLSGSGLRCGREFFVAFSPEREDPGNTKFNTASIPKIVGGVDQNATELACAMYRLALDKVVPVSSARVAEATKLTENIFRSVNIALVNELKVVFDRMNIDIWEVLDAAASKPFGFMKFSPGPGLGGHCIPLDPFYLTWKAREYGLSTRFIELAGEINVSMPRYVIDKLQFGLNQNEKSVKGSTVLVLGLAYKKDIDDTRESPSFELIEQLLHLGAKVAYHDPHVPLAPSVRSWPNLPPMRSIELTAEAVKSFDAVVVSTDHTVIDYGMIATNARLIVDSRGVYREHSPIVIRA